MYSFISLDPDGCLVADQLRGRTKTLEKPGAEQPKGHAPLWTTTLQKNILIFCDGEVFSLDSSLLMGAVNLLKYLLARMYRTGKNYLGNRP